MANDSDRLWVDSMPEAYERWLVPTIFRPFAVDLAQRVASSGGRRVLELAAGTGVLTAELVRALPGADVTATDLNDAMVEVGRARVPDASWRQADALDLPFDAAQFDVVVCQFGVMFFPDKSAAFTEARRVLAPDGVLHINTWAALDTHAFQRALVAGLERAFPDDPPRFMASVPHGYADLDVVVADVEAGGLRCVRAEIVTLDGRAATVSDVAAGFCLGTPIRGEIEARGDLEAAMGIVTAVMEEQLGRGAVTGTMAAHVLAAQPDV